MNKPREDEIRIATEATQWQQALEDGKRETRAEFADWVKASPRHLREFLFMEALDAAAKNIDPEHRIPVELNPPREDDTVIRLRKPSILSGHAEPHNRRLFSSWWLPFKLAIPIGFATAAAMGFTWWFNPGVLGGWERYSTSIGEQRTIELADGSVLQLNTQSQVRVRLSKASRDVRLLQGEALFKVAHDRSRPFQVHTHDAVIRAVGTQFDVYQLGQKTNVAVIEGKVEIQPIAVAVEPVLTAPISPLASAPHKKTSHLLAAGQTASVQGTGEVVADRVADLSEVASWRQRRLVFREEALGQIADEFNRYNRSPQIVVDGAAARDQRYGGTFDADDPEALVGFLESRGAVEIERRGDQIVIRAR